MSELPIVTFTPTLDGIVAQQSTSVCIRSTVNALGGEAGAEVDGSQGIAHLAVAVTVKAVADIVGAAYSELALIVSAPALDGVIVQYSARVIIATLHVLGSEAVAEFDGGEGIVVAVDIHPAKPRFSTQPLMALATDGLESARARVLSEGAGKDVHTHLLVPQDVESCVGARAWRTGTPDVFASRLQRLGTTN